MAEKDISTIAFEEARACAEYFDELERKGAPPLSLDSFHNSLIIYSEGYGSSIPLNYLKPAK